MTLLLGILYGGVFGALPLRWICGLIFVLFVPGYALQSVLFLHSDTLDLPERLALSIGLSVGLAPLFAWGLDTLRFTRIELWPILITEGGFALICLIVAQARRTPTQFRVDPAQSGSGGLIKQFSTWWMRQGRGGRLLLLLLTGALLVGGIAAVNLNGDGSNPLGSPKTGALSAQAPFTEFYILGADGLGDNYPRTTLAVSPQAQRRQPLTVTVGIHNRERQPATYRVLVVHDQDDTTPAMLITQTGTLQLAPDERREIRCALHLSHFTLPTSHIEVQFLLYREGIEGPYRTLRLWLNVVE